MSNKVTFKTCIYSVGVHPLASTWLETSVDNRFVDMFVN